MSDEPARVPDAPNPTAEPTPDPPATRARAHGVLAALFCILASVAVLAGAFAVWAHQTLLTAQGWGDVVGEVIADQEVVDSVSAVLVERLGHRLGLNEAVADALPGPDFIAGAITRVVQDRVTDAVANFASSDTFEEAFVRANERAHDAAMRAIRGGDSAALTSQGGTITVEIFPLIEGVLVSLQDAGIIDASRQIPDLANAELPSRAVEALESVLGRDVPDDVGTIVLVDSENLALVQTVVRWADVGTGLLLLLWAGFTALALWLSQRRMRMVMWLAAGALVALLLGRFVARVVLEGITRREREPEVQVLVDAIIDAAEQSYLWFTFLLMAVALVVGLAAWLMERGSDTEPAAEASAPGA
jgi:hypothetical protein